MPTLRDAAGSGGTVDRAAALARVRSAADPNGFVPFDRFMEIALYDDTVGFYASERLRLGPHGDFYTAAHVHPLFARAVARRLEAVREALGAPRPFSIVEVGPGDGALAEGIVRSLGVRDGPRGPTEYVLADRSGARRREALARARAAGEVSGIAVRERSTISSDDPIVGAVIANEVLDAQPTRRLRWDGAAWCELGVRVRDDRVVPAESHPARPVPGPPLPSPLPEGTVVELSPVAEAIVREVGDALARGAFVVLDYGLEEPELLAAHPRGTLAGVRSHRVVADPLNPVGEHDLSAFVNFTRVRAAARSAGWVEIACERQAEALGRWGFEALLRSALDEVRSSEEEVRTRLAAKNLLFGFDRFRVLELAAPASAGALAPVTPGGRADGR